MHPPVVLDLLLKLQLPLQLRPLLQQPLHPPLRLLLLPLVFCLQRPLA